MEDKYILYEIHEWLDGMKDCDITDFSFSDNGESITIQAED